MNIYNPDNTLLLAIEVDDSSERIREIMSKDELNINFSLSYKLDIPIGARCSFGEPATTYELLSPAVITLNHTRDYQYSLVFSAPQGRAKRYLVHDADNRIVFSLTADATTNLELIVRNLNEREPGVWSVGECVDTEQKEISYNAISCFDALTQIATTFDTEWEVIGTQINLHKVEYNKSAPLQLSYANGFKPGIERSNSANLISIQTVYAQGGTNNIDSRRYPGNGVRSNTLLLPRSFSFGFDGKYIQTEQHTEVGYERGGRIGVQMVTDDNGYSVALYPTESQAAEDGIDASNIYPKRVGKVSAVWYEWRGNAYSYSNLLAKLTEVFGSLSAVPDEVWAKEVLVDICDDSIPDSLDYSDDDLIIAGEQQTVIFQGGQLAGKEFDIVEFSKDAKTVGAITVPGNRFELRNASIDGLYMPSEGLHPSANDTYAVFHCGLPSSYFMAWNESEGMYEGAEIDMLRKAAEYLYENCTPRYTYNGKLSGIWAKENWDTIYTKLVLGGYVSYQEEGSSAPYLVRIVSIVEKINDFRKPELKLDNKTIRGGVASGFKRLESEGVAVARMLQNSQYFTRRSFRDAIETAEALVNLGLENFSGIVNPIVVRTMQSIVGDSSLQFVCVASRLARTKISLPYSYNPTTRSFSVSDCGIQHMTLGIDDITVGSQRGPADYYCWQMHGIALATDESVTSTEITFSDSDINKKFYLYAKVTKQTNADKANITSNGPTVFGKFILSENSKEIDSGDYYYLLVGYLNSEYGRERSFAPFFGFSEILPGQITTDIIRGSRSVQEGGLLIDLINNTITGTVHFQSDSTGLEDIDAFKKLIEIANGNIQTWFSDDVSPEQTGDPNLYNYPAFEWTTSAERDTHIGDLYYSNEGKAFRFRKSGGIYGWIANVDTDIAEALALAQAAKNAADDAKDAAGDVSGNLDDLHTYLDGAFKDGVISDTEKSRIESYLKQLATSKADADNTYAKVYNSEYLDDEGKSALKLAKDAFDKKYNELIGYIEDVVWDDEYPPVTRVEIERINEAYDEYNIAYGNYILALETANEAIRKGVENAILERIGHEYGYLKAALEQETTQMGGLILTSLIQLGYADDQGVRHTLSGINGIPIEGTEERSIAAWFGGPMVDHELSPSATDYAKSLFRFDGTGYLAKGNITWDENGYGQVGGSGDNYAIKWDSSGIRLGNGVRISPDGSETLGTILTLLNKFDSWFGEDSNGDIYVKAKNGSARNLYTYGDVMAGARMP